MKAEIDQMNKFRALGIAKYAILTHVQALKFGFLEFLHYLKAEMDQMNKFRALRIAKFAHFCLFESIKHPFRCNPNGIFSSLQCAKPNTVGTGIEVGSTWYFFLKT